jgi:hypothetical protein
MDSILYKLFFYTTAAEEQPDLCEQRETLGIRQLLTADMSWSNQKFSSFSVDLYPSLEAARSYARIMHEACGSIPGESYLGIPMDENYPDFFAPMLREGESPVYRVYFSRPTPQAYEVEAKKYQAALQMITESRTRAGGRPLIAAYMRWNNEEWEYFGVERFPSINALLAYSQFLTENRWYRYTQAISYIGVATGGILSGLE